VLIAGEQRYRAARMAGLTEAPVVVLDVSDDQVEVLRIEENLRRRGLKPSETARAIRRLYELHGIVPGKRPVQATPSTSSPGEEVPTTKTAVDIARDAGMGITKASILNRLADLIPELMQLLDAETITQAVAYQLAQLPSAPPVPRPPRGPALERFGPWATARSLWAGPVRLHDDMPARGTDAWVGLRFITQGATSAFGIQDQIAVLYAADLPGSEAYPGHAAGAALAFLAGVADVH